MSDDVKTTRSAVAKIQQDMNALNRLANPSYFSVIGQLERTFGPIRLQQLEFSHALEMLRAAARVREVASANQHWQEMIKQAVASNHIAESLHAVHQSWSDQVNSLQQGVSQFSQVQASTKLTLCNASLQLTATELLMTGIDFEAIRSRFQIEMPVILGLERSIAHVATSYGGLAKSLRKISDITRLPAFILPGATREIYTASFALKTLCSSDELNGEEVEMEIQLVAEAERETSGCIALLQQVDPRLAQPYIGARDALYSNNADRARHILTSLRELWTHLLNQLAPDESVAVWISGIVNQKDLLHEGKPTRRARILYVCRELNNGPLADFLVHDTRALVSLIELFNRVHELESKLTDKQLRTLLLRSDSSLMYILQIWLQSSTE